MFAFARRPEPQRRPIGAPGITDDLYEHFTERLRAEKASALAAQTRGAVRRLPFQPTTINEGTRP